MSRNCRLICVMFEMVTPKCGVQMAFQRHFWWIAPLMPFALEQSQLVRQWVTRRLSHWHCSGHCVVCIDKRIRVPSQWLPRVTCKNWTQTPDWRRWLLVANARERRSVSGIWSKESHRRKEWLTWPSYRPSTWSTSAKKRQISGASVY